jgi:hypothetical protein
MLLCVNRIPPEQKNPVSWDALRISNTAGAKPDSLLSGKFPSLRNSEYRRSNSPRNTLLQIAVELRWSNLSSPPAVSYHHALANCSAGNPPPRGNPGLKCTRTDVILRKFDRKMNFKFIKNIQHDRTNVRSIQLHHLQPSPISWDYPLKETFS